MYKGSEKDYFGGMGGAEPPKTEGQVKPESKHGEDEGVTTHTHKRGEKFHSSVDKHDGLPPDEFDHDQKEEGAEHHAEALEEKYGEDSTEPEEPAEPVHGKSGGGYLKQVMGE